MNYKTEQEAFWAGDFGDEYVKRNHRAITMSSRISTLAKILRATQSVDSVIEFGANIGLNLEAIKLLLPNVSLAAIEINQSAIEALKQIDGLNIYASSILDFTPDTTRELALIKGVLIHINPDELQSVYDKLYRASHRYICIAEYYNPTPVEVPYRGHSGKLFKRDFAGEMLDKYPDLRLVDYGFVYHRDNIFPQDDMTWFLLEKR